MSERTYCILENGCDRGAAECKQRCLEVKLEPSDNPSSHPDPRMRLTLKKIDPCDPTEWKNGERVMPPFAEGGKY